MILQNIDIDKNQWELVYQVANIMDGMLGYLTTNGLWIQIIYDNVYIQTTRFSEIFSHKSVLTQNQSKPGAVPEFGFRTDINMRKLKAQSKRQFQNCFCPNPFARSVRFHKGHWFHSIIIYNRLATIVNRRSAEKSKTFLNLLDNNNQ